MTNYKKKENKKRTVKYSTTFRPRTDRRKIPKVGPCSDWKGKHIKFSDWILYAEGEEEKENIIRLNITKAVKL